MEAGTVGSIQEASGGGKDVADINEEVVIVNNLPSPGGEEVVSLNKSPPPPHDNEEVVSVNNSPPPAAEDTPTRDPLAKVDSSSIDGTPTTVKTTKTTTTTTDTNNNLEANSNFTMIHACLISSGDGDQPTSGGTTVDGDQPTSLITSAGGGRTH